MGKHIWKHTLHINLNIISNAKMLLGIAQCYLLQDIISYFNRVLNVLNVISWNDKNARLLQLKNVAGYVQRIDG